MSQDGRRRKLPRKTVMSNVRSSHPQEYAFLQVPSVARASNNNEENDSVDSVEEQRRAVIRDFRMLWEQDFESAFSALATSHLNEQVETFFSTLQTFASFVTERDTMHRDIAVLQTKVLYLENAVRVLERRLANVPAQVNANQP